MRQLTARVRSQPHPPEERIATPPSSCPNMHKGTHHAGRQTMWSPSTRGDSPRHDGFWRREDVSLQDDQKSAPITSLFFGEKNSTEPRTPGARPPCALAPIHRRRSPVPHLLSDLDALLVAGFAAEPAEVSNFPSPGEGPRVSRTGGLSPSCVLDVLPDRKKRPRAVLAFLPQPGCLGAFPPSPPPAPPAGGSAPPSLLRRLLRLLLTLVLLDTESSKKSRPWDALSSSRGRSRSLSDAARRVGRVSLSSSDTICATRRCP